MSEPEIVSAKQRVRKLSLKTIIYRTGKGRTKSMERIIFHAGAVLMCPMLTVSDEVKPPWIVQQFFKYVVAPLMPSWPITPSVETWQHGTSPCISHHVRLIWVATIV